MVGSASCRAHAKSALSHVPFEIATADDPYTAAVEVCRRPLAYRAMVLCMHSTYREELSIVTMLKQRFSHIDVYLSQTDGRAAATVDAMRRGADGLLAEDGLHRFSELENAPPQQPQSASVVTTAPAVATAPIAPPPPPVVDTRGDGNVLDDTISGEAVLTAEELHALLHDQPTMPPSEHSEA